MKKGGQGKRFLIVDDSAIVRRILTNSLSRIGFNDVVEATDGLEAIDRLDGTFDCVITDWNMPNMNGLELVHAIRASGSSVPIVMVSVRSGRSDIVEAVAAGVDSYIVKPFRLALFREKVEQVLTDASEREPLSE